MSTTVTALELNSPIGAAQAERDERVLESALSLAAAGFRIAPAKWGNSQSYTPQWQLIATTYPKQIKEWFKDHSQFAVVANRPEGTLIDIDRVRECKELGFRIEWLNGVKLDLTPGKGLHAFLPWHDAFSRLPDTSVINVCKDGKKILEWKLPSASVACPWAWRDSDPERHKEAGWYRPVTGHTELGQCPEPDALVDWVLAHSVAKTRHGSVISGWKFHPDFKDDLYSEFLDYHDCTYLDEGESDSEPGRYFVAVEKCPICCKPSHEDGTGSLAHARAKFMFGGRGYGYKCQACDAGKTELVEHFKEEYEDWKWDKPIYEGDDKTDEKLRKQAGWGEILRAENGLEPKPEETQHESTIRILKAEPEPKPSEVDELIRTMEDVEDLDTGTNLGYTYRNTHTGNAERLVKMHGDRLRWISELESWAVNKPGEGWSLDTTSHAMHLTKDVIDKIVDDAEAEGDEKTKGSLMAHAKASGQLAGRKGMLACAQSEPGIHTNFNDWDADPLALNCTNGVLDLRTGQLRPWGATDYFLRKCGTAYDPKAECPLWKDAINTWMCGDRELAAYVKCAVGVSLTSINMQSLFFCEGDGANGKDTFFNAVHGVMGGYFASAPMSSFLSYRKVGRDKRDDLADLAGAIRLVVASESAEGGRLDEDVIKLVTGGGLVTGRGNYAKHAISYVPQWKLWMMSNHQPFISGTDWAIWRRVKRIPWRFSFKDSGKLDPEFGEKLKAEYPGILGWALTGLMIYRLNGSRLPDCKAVKDATEEMRRDMDNLGMFIDERVSFGNSLSVASDALYTAYEAWCCKSGLKEKTKPVFIKEFKKRCSEVTDGRMTLDPSKREIRTTKGRMQNGLEGCGLDFEKSTDTALEPEDI